MRFSLEKKKEREAYIRRDQKILFKEGFKTCCHIYSKYRNDICSIYKGNIRVGTKDYGIIVFYPPKYPYCPPLIFPTNPLIINNRHQDPSDTKIPGKLCLYNSDKTNDWSIGFTIEDVFNKVRNWFQKYENGTLKDELAPPEEGRYYPPKLKDYTISFHIIEELQKQINETINHIGILKIFEEDKKLKTFFINHQDVSLFQKYDGLLYDLKNVKDKLYILCFDIDREPFPIIKSTLDLYKFIIKYAISLKLSNNKLAKLISKRFIALRYYKNNVSRWMFFFSPEINYNPIKGIPKGFRNYASAIKTYGNKLIKFYPDVHYYSYNSIFKRNNNQFDNLLNKNILILGVGTIGSKIAELLVKTGIKSLSILDKDELKVGNICRHILTVDSVGKNKAEELAIHLLKINPFLEITSIAGNLFDENKLDRKEILSYDLIVSCIGNNTIETYISNLINKKVDVIYVRSYLYSSIGEIIYSAKHGLSFIEIKQNLNNPKNNIPEIPQLPFEQTYKYDRECGTPFIPAAAIDIDYISLLATHLILDILDDNKTITNNYFLVCGRKIDNISYPEEIKQFSQLKYKVIK